jgi:hypothetical protein
MSSAALGTSSSIPNSKRPASAFGNVARAFLNLSGEHAFREDVDPTWSRLNQRLRVGDPHGFEALESSVNKAANEAGETDAELVLVARKKLIV